MTPNELRSRYLEFFEQRDHKVMPSAPLVPENDPSLLFTGAGMNQFKDEFLGKGRRGLTRATTSQKCLRTGDLENVGRTAGHHSFFEMLGNFSFGDYFKRQAILWAWEFITDVMELDAERLSATVYLDDDEAYQVWHDEVGIPQERLYRFDAKENYWPADAIEKGPNGPCGPCSEIFFDYGPQGDCDDPEHCNPACDCNRFVEIWNLVFTQFERHDGGRLTPLPQKNIDTGAGFERLVAVMEGVKMTLHSSLLRPILNTVARLAGRDCYASEGEDGVRMRRITDHVRAACFLVGDGVRPGNEGRGYVLRRILRRAIRDGHGLGIGEPFLAGLVAPVVETMGDAYPDLRDGREFLESVLNAEEAQFRKTFAKGLRRLDAALEEARTAGRSELDGERVFQLYDTFGFPVDVTAEILAEQGFTFSRERYTELMQEQRERSRGASKMTDDIFERGPLGQLAESGVARTVFLGYGDPDSAVPEERSGVASRARIAGILDSDGRRLLEELAPGAEAVLVLDRTPFYAESGGQVGDAGCILVNGGTFHVQDSRAQGGYTLHAGRYEGTCPFRPGDECECRVDVARRDAIRRNHTATHLFHRALKDLVGDSVKQAGSHVGPDRLRFDFTLDQGLTGDQIAAIEAAVNAEIVKNADLDTRLMAVEEAKQSGAVALFGEKYPDPVRVVTVGEYSRELCGGTHCHAAGDIGSFRITNESSIAAGIRRIEGVTGPEAVQLMQTDRAVLGGLARALGVPAGDVGARVEKLMKDLRTARKQAKSVPAASFDPLQGDPIEAGGVRLHVHLLDLPREAIAGAGQALVKRPGEAVAALMVTRHEGKVAAVAAGNPAAVAAGFDAPTCLRAAGGKGGGRPGMAQGTIPGDLDVAALRAGAAASLSAR